MANQDYQDWIRKVVIPVSFRSLTDTPGSFDGATKKTIVVNDTETALVYSDLNLDNHSARHEEGGADEVTGITGKLNDHSARHEEGGVDEVTGITGKLNNHSARHENGGADEINVAGLSGELADKQDPQGHGTRHKDGGVDELDAAELAGALGVSDQVLKTDGAKCSWANVEISTGVISSGTGSTSGSLGSNDEVEITMNANSFFPMISADQSGLVRLSAAYTEATADDPRFRLYNTSTISSDYVVKWRYMA